MTFTNIKYLIGVFAALAFALLFAGGGQLDRWAAALLQDPDGYFASNYEQRIFENFRRKFPQARLGSAKTVENNLRLELLLPEPYQLLIVRDEEHRVKSVQRLVDGLTPATGIAAEGIDWLGQLFYRIDAGDTAALLDFLFFEDIGIHYGDAASRAVVARRLLNDFPKIIRARDIHVKQADGALQIRFTTNRSRECLIALPLKRADRRPVDELQSALLRKIKEAVNEGAKARKRRSSAGENAMRIPYLTHKVPQLAEMYYERAANGNLSPVIRWSATGEAAMIMNDALSVDYFGEGPAHTAEWDAGKQLIANLYQWCIDDFQLSELQADRQLRLNIEYRGYHTRELRLSSLRELQVISTELRGEGNFYFYPVSIEHRQGKMAINGMVYIAAEKGAAHYHFIEIAATIDQQGQLKGMNWVLYPYVRS